MKELLTLSLALMLTGTSFAAVVSGQGTWETTLLARDLDGNLSSIEAYYDTVLDITWLADANLASSSSFGVAGVLESGRMNWDTALIWVQSMNEQSYLGLSNWRLPETSPVNGVEFQILPVTYDGSTDQAFNIGTDDSLYPDFLGSELSHMYYQTLGNVGAADVYGNLYPCRLTTCLVNVGPFANLVSGDYWTQTEYQQNVALDFQMQNGAQNFPYKTEALYAWAVTSGDPFVSVPIPAATWLFLSAVGGLIGIKGRFS